MKTRRRELIEIVGVLAVIASLLFLAYEIRQSNQIARSTITFELGKNAADLNEVVLSNPGFAELLVKSQDPHYHPTAVEKQMLLAEARRFLNLWGTVEIAYRNGHQTRAQFDIMLDDAEGVLSRRPAAHYVWRKELKRFPGLSTFEFYARAMQVIDPDDSDPESDRHGKAEEAL